MADDGVILLGECKLTWCTRLMKIEDKGWVKNVRGKKEAICELCRAGKLNID